MQKRAWIHPDQMNRESYNFLNHVSCHIQLLRLKPHLWKHKHFASLLAIRVHTSYVKITECNNRELRRIYIKREKCSGIPKRRPCRIPRFARGIWSTGVENKITCTFKRLASQRRFARADGIWGLFPPSFELYEVSFFASRQLQFEMSKSLHFGIGFQA